MGAVAIVVAYEPGDELSDALAAYSEASVPVVLVDNGGSASHPLAGRHLLVTGHGNIGYGSALNVGYGAAKESFADLNWILLANADVIPSQQLLRAVADDALPVEFDVVGFQDPAGTDAWRRPMPSARATVMTALGREGQYLERMPAERSYAVGAMLAIRSDVFFALDGFDPRYFLYFEEVDLIERAVQAGYRFGFAPLPITYEHRAHTSTARIGAESFREIGRAAAIHFRNGRQFRLIPWLLTQIASLTAQAVRARLIGDPRRAQAAELTLHGLLTGLVSPARAERRSQLAFGWRRGFWISGIASSKLGRSRAAPERPRRSWRHRLWRPR